MLLLLLLSLSARVFASFKFILLDVMVVKWFRLLALLVLGFHELSKELFFNKLHWRRKGREERQETKGRGGVEKTEEWCGVGRERGEGEQKEGEIFGVRP